MPYIEPLPPEEIRDPELLEMIRQCPDLGVPDPLFLGVLARVPGYAKALFRALHSSHTEGGVSHKLKEIIRVRLARTAKDPYFARLRSEEAKKEGLTEEMIEAGSGDYDGDPRFAEAEKWALRYAEQMYLDATKIDEGFYAEMKRHFTEAQIMELGAFIALHYGMQVFMRTLQAFPALDPEGNEVTQEQSKKISGADLGR